MLANLTLLHLYILLYILNILVYNDIWALLLLLILLIGPAKSGYKKHKVDESTDEDKHVDRRTKVAERTNDRQSH